MNRTSLLNFRKSAHIHVLLFILTAVSTVYVVKEVIRPNVDIRIQFEERILSGDHDPPYQYRILKPMIARGIQQLLVPANISARAAHLLSHSAIVGICFLLTYYLFFLYLRKFFEDHTAITGSLLLGLIVPLSTTGYYMVGDFMTFMFFTAGFLLMFSDRDRFLPLLIFIAAFNRQQIVVLLIFYAIYLYSRNRPPKSRQLVILAAGATAFAVAWLTVRLYFGFRPDPYPFILHVSSNLDIGNLVARTGPLWIAQIIGFVVLSCISFNRVGKFFRLSLLFLVPYTLLFFVKGYLWELAKFLPVYLILIPMSLETILSRAGEDRSPIPTVSGRERTISHYSTEPTDADKIKQG